MKRLCLLIALVIAVTVSVGLREPLSAESDQVIVQIAKKGKLALDGESVQLKLRIKCPAGMELLEGFVYITQNGYQSDYGPLNPVCDDQVHRYYVTVTNAVDNPPFQEGAANASAYILLIVPGSEDTLSGQANRTIKLKQGDWSKW